MIKITFSSKVLRGGIFSKKKYYCKKYNNYFFLMV